MTDSNSDTESLTDRMKSTRRAFLSALGAGAGAAAIGSASLQDGGGDDGVQAAGLSTSLTEQHRRSHYVTTPGSALDTSVLKTGEKVHVTDTGEYFVWDGNAKQHPPIGSSSQPVPSFHTDEARTRNLHAMAPSHQLAGRGLAGQTVTFETEYVGSLFGSDYYDPLVVHHTHFTDNQYRVIAQNVSTNDHELHKTPDPTDKSAYTLIESDILPNRQTGGGYSLQDHVVLPDGRFALYESIDDANGIGTAVWTGESLTDLTNHGRVLDWPDCGAFLDHDGTIHIYPEGSQLAGEPSSDILRHYTTPWTDLTTATRQADAIDVSAENWHTGDPDIIQVGGYYYMFMDRTVSHPTYQIAVARSTNLTDWTLVNDAITLTKGGDIAITQMGGRLVGLTEFDGSDEAGIGARWLTPVPDAVGVQEARTTGFDIEWHPHSLEGVTTAVSGSGSAPAINAGTGAVELVTGATDNSHSTFQVFRYYNWSADGRTPSWERDRTFVADVDFKDTQDRLYIVTGSLAKDDKTGRHVGFAMKNGDLIGTVGNGTSETTTTLVSGASTGQKHLRAEYRSQNSPKVEFYVGGVKQGEITSGLPGSRTDSFRVLHAIAENADSGASSRQMNVFGARIIQHW